MTKDKKLIAIVLALFTILELFISGCQKNTTAVIPLMPETVTKTVSFSKDLVPILTDNCALSGCHVKGAHAPDLTADNAYNSLTNGSYIDKSSPENSVVYERLTGELSPAMPLGKSQNPSNIDGLMLAWIKQGAKNN
jgi:hypothetical protein